MLIGLLPHFLDIPESMTMASMSASLPVQLADEARHVFVPRKKLKTSELPLSSAQRSTIDTLLHTIKKKGVYDTLRKQVWSEYTDSVSWYPNHQSLYATRACLK